MRGNIGSTAKSHSVVIGCSLKEKPTHPKLVYGLIVPLFRHGNGEKLNEAGKPQVEQSVATQRLQQAITEM
jgi:hypothetical protein